MMNIKTGMDRFSFALLYFLFAKKNFEKRNFFDKIKERRQWKRNVAKKKKILKFETIKTRFYTSRLLSSIFLVDHISGLFSLRYPNDLVYLYKLGMVIYLIRGNILKLNIDLKPINVAELMRTTMMMIKYVNCNTVKNNRKLMSEQNEDVNE